LFADAVVDVSGPTSLFATVLDEQASGTARAELLEPTAHPASHLPHSAQLPAGVERAVAISGDILNAQVDAEEAFRISNGRRLTLQGEMQPEAALVGQVAQVYLSQRRPAQSL